MKTLFDLRDGSPVIPVTERIKTFDDACRALGIDKVQIGIVGLDKDCESIEAYLKLIVIARALNEGWEPDWSNSSEGKYMPWFEHKSGFGLAYGDYDFWFSCAGVGSRLCFKSKELAIYAGKQFADIYNDYLTIKQ
ncbi:hypothetical protein QEG73_21815 [Chitinophagaceae bacterium 26-R-25]|nr:hypothetical protein [Chitinophagaceae bacterium 26-R-25]